MLGLRVLAEGLGKVRAPGKSPLKGAIRLP